MKTLLLIALFSITSLRVTPQSKISPPSPGPSLRFEQISTESGLSQSWVWCILQDSKGFLWIGTKDGLNRYDGYRFTVYKHDPRNPGSLSNNIVTALYEDRGGGLWIGTEGGGLNRFNRAQETFETYRHDPENDSSISFDSITSIYEDASGALWIGTSGGGLNRMDKSSGTFDRFAKQPGDPKSISDNWILSILEDRLGVLWIGTRGGLNRLDRRNHVFTTYVHDPRDPRTIDNNIVSSICEDENGTLWVGTWSGVNRFERQGNHFTRPLLDKVNAKNLVTAILEDNEHTLWITTSGNGLYRYDPRTKAAGNYKTDIADPNSPTSNLLTCAWQDRSGLLWFGTKSHGVIKHDPRTQQFRHYRHQLWNNQSLSQNYVRTIFESASGEIWIGTGTGGLNRFDRSSNEFVHYSADVSDQKSLSNPDVTSVREDRSGLVWIGTAGGGLNRLDKRTNIFRRFYPNNSRDMNDNVIYSLCFDRAGFLWIGTWGGLNKFDPRQETNRHYRRRPNDPGSLSDDFVRTVYEDRRGVIWAGTNLGGLNRYDPQSDAFVRYTHEPRHPAGISHNTIECLYEDSGGKFWIGTFGGGLNLLDRETGQFRYYSTKDGLPSDVIHGILEDDQSNLWLSTNIGLSRFDPATETFENYDESDGLQSNEFTTNAYHKTRSGEMFFGGINGFNVFHPDSIRRNPFPPSVVVTGFQIFNRPVGVKEPNDEGRIVLDRSISETDQLELSHKDYVFSFEFASLDFTNPARNKYQYLMEGFDADWNDAGTRRFVTYTNLDPGEYVFRVKASNNHGVWNDAGASIAIIIVPPFWQTWWFRTLSLMILATAVFLVHRRRLKSIESRKVALEIQVREKSEAARKIQEALSEVEALKRQLEAENIYLQDEIKLSHNFESIISASEAMRRIFHSIEQVAATNTTILILGETGTGKELIARSIHSLSPRRMKPLIKVNCAALPATLIESELFGHEKGTFTGALSQRTGRFELADGGTIFLDEIGDLPLDLQTKLLRVLQEGQFERLGGTSTISVDVRVISATNRDLQRLIREGSFREDLFYRLNVFPLVIPPLRKRKEDIPLLVKHFVQKHSVKSGKAIESIPAGSMEKLLAYDWPGNVRELENVIERSVVSTRLTELRIDDSAFDVQGSRIDSPSQTLEEYERDYILHVLEQTNWRISGQKGAAKILGLKPTTLEFRMKKLGIMRP